MAVPCAQRGFSPHGGWLKTIAAHLVTSTWDQFGIGRVAWRLPSLYVEPRAIVARSLFRTLGRSLVFLTRFYEKRL